VRFDAYDDQYDSPAQRRAGGCRDGEGGGGHGRSGVRLSREEVSVMRGRVGVMGVRGMGGV